MGAEVDQMRGALRDAVEIGERNLNARIAADAEVERLREENAALREAGEALRYCAAAVNVSHRRVQDALATWDALCRPDAESASTATDDKRRGA